LKTPDDENNTLQYVGITISGHKALLEEGYSNVLFFPFGKKRNNIYR
jgi:H2-forming N5,N10-methylenetetrahydromethanopterin dehydrogenase-like enzyme